MRLPVSFWGRLFDFGRFRMKGIKINVYIDNGNVYSYRVPDEEAVRDHCHEIITSGYRSSHGQHWTWYPPHRIKKIKLKKPLSTNYSDEVSGT